ncbi:putative necrosis-inducing factor-domain-containing protein [Podospora fimiseda]|uniref:Necrosis-inducing factor-domain-containing protein n=1 Tax=Podospora fimiseda TaxID=252190 RepID=A0AAN7BJB6_9PEZI|nr:putative necrosis-inducing factor-domain-containing protein [Podospora fimiseda]
MHLLFLTIFTLLLPLVHSNPSVHFCQDLSHTGETTFSSPSVSDCKSLADNFSRNGGQTYPQPASGQRALGHFGTCVLGFTGTSSKGGKTINIGNEDAARWVTQAIAFFERDLGDGVPRVGAKGDVSCVDGDGYWGVYHS